MRRVRALRFTRRGPPVWDGSVYRGSHKIDRCADIAGFAWQPVSPLPSQFTASGAFAKDLLNDDGGQGMDRPHLFGIRQRLRLSYVGAGISRMKRLI